MAEVAYVYHWPPSELDAMTVDDLLLWHGQAARIQREVNKAP